MKKFTGVKTSENGKKTHFVEGLITSEQKYKEFLIASALAKPGKVAKPAKVPKEIPSENPQGHEPSTARKGPKKDKRKSPEFIAHLRRLAQKRKLDAAIARSGKAWQESVKADAEAEAAHAWADEGFKQQEKSKKAAKKQEKAKKTVEKIPTTLKKAAPVGKPKSLTSGQFASAAASLANELAGDVETMLSEGGNYTRTDLCSALSEACIEQYSFRNGVAAPGYEEVFGKVFDIIIKRL